MWRPLKRFILSHRFIRPILDPNKVSPLDLQSLSAGDPTLGSLRQTT